MDLPNRIGIPGKLEFKGNEISYCATCDTKYFVDNEVVVIGGGNSAIEETNFISKVASKITKLDKRVRRFLISVINTRLETAAPVKKG